MEKYGNVLTESPHTTTTTSVFFCFMTFKRKALDIIGAGCYVRWTAE